MSSSEAPAPVWLDNCACRSSDPKQRMHHSVVHGGPRAEVLFYPLTAETDGWDADGAPVPATYPINLLPV